MRRLIAYALPPLLTIALALAAIEFVVARGWVQDFLLPPPSQVWHALVEPGTDLWLGAPAADRLGGVASTARDAVIGFAIAVGLGTTLAIAMASNRWIKRSLYPYAAFFQTVPIVAIAPMLVVWLGFGSPTVRAAACLASIFPVIANTYAGLASTEPAMLDLFRLYGAGWFAATFRLRLPAAMPSVFTGLRVAAGLAVIGAIVGEFLGGGGLGAVIESAKPQLRNDKIFAAVVLASMLGLAMIGVVNFTAWITLRRWHASARAR